MKKLGTIIIILIFSNRIYSQERFDSLIVFVGEKIAVVGCPNSTYQDTMITESDTIITVHLALDSKFIATYKINQLVNGSYSNDTISFIVFDHYGNPAFSKFKNVLLFVKPLEGKYYHEKYQYFPVYKTTNDRWASPYNSLDYNHPDSKSFTVKPEEILFEEEISYEIAGLTNEQIKSKFPEPYYLIQKQKAIAIFGNYVEELVLIKKQGILKARGYQ